jgi:probable rRNA maturation factor
MIDPQLQENKILVSAGGLKSSPPVYFPEPSEENIGNQLIIFRKKIAGLGKSTLERFVLRARRAARLPGIANVLVTNSRELRAFNKRFRGIDKATDVLTFPALPIGRRQTDRAAGDVAISADIARENARRLGHSFAEEIKILALHGILHLAGFDHEEDKGEMAREEIRLRRRLKLKVGLIERIELDGKRLSTHGERRHGLPRTKRRSA